MNTPDLTLPGGWRWSSLGSEAEPLRGTSQVASVPLLTFKGLRVDGRLDLQSGIDGRGTTAIPAMSFSRSRAT